MGRSRAMGRRVWMEVKGCLMLSEFTGFKLTFRVFVV